MTSLLIATRNRHKVREIQAVLGGGFEHSSLEAFPNAPEVIEDAASFAGNATKKAVALAEWLAARKDVSAGGRRFVLADDSGLEVDALGGAPGVLSARFAALDSGAAGNSPDAANNAKLLRLLGALPLEKRTARFRCVMAVALAPESRESPAAVTLFEGACEGTILFQPRGVSGFGYDPLFRPVGFDHTFAELGEETKNSISHRARALAQARRWFLETAAMEASAAGPPMASWRAWPSASASSV